MGSECINFAGSKSERGYGIKRINKKTYKAHRLAYCEFMGIPIESISGLVIRHKCDNRLCVNPDHLEPGSQADNMRDMAIRKRQVDRKGEQNPRSKVTQKQVDNIRNEYVKGSSTKGLLFISTKYGISQNQASQIIRGICWK